MHEETLSDGTTLTIDPNGQYGVEFTVRDADRVVAHGEVWLGRLTTRNGPPGDDATDGGELSLEAMVKIINAAAKTRHRIPVQRTG